VKPQIGLNFASLLRSILRHDPDVIMIGEIRDLETAQIAVQASLTGRLVLSTVHTNSAAATVTRLRDMGVEDYLLTATLKGVLAQRLVRRLCPGCKAVDPSGSTLIERFGMTRLAPANTITLYHPVGGLRFGAPAIAGRGGTPNWLVRGRAPDRAAVVDRLQRQGQIVLRADPADGRRGLSELLQLELGGARALDKTALGEVTRELAIMLGAGQDLDRALRFIVENTRSARARAVLGNVRDKVRGGSSLAAALAAEPGSFSKLYVGLVRAGEAGGTLPATLDRLSTLLERERSLSANLRSAMIYPALLIVAAIGSIVLLLDYVLPQFAPIFEQAGAQLPASTRTLMMIGQLVGAGAPWLLIALAVAALVARRALAAPPLRLKADRLLLRLPLAGRLLKETLAARLTRTLGTLLQNGVPLIPALAIAKETLGNL